ncbi:MAG TPA: aldehyde dehydrogenase (NADP(+)) [Streptosporangiaceae bacterium]|nr:aldehyde dehydrogenase (NADP(+)) [Streptosporangiaceae bacterium]
MIQGYDPRTGEPVGEPVLETPAEGVDALVELAASVAGEWAGLAPSVRADVLAAVADALDSQADELAALADSETALGEVRLTGEVGRTTGQLRLFAGVLRDGGYLDVAHSPGEPDLRRINRPVGPVAVFAASNFPFAFSVAGGDTASALAAGCPVIVKAHEGHPRTSMLTAQVVSGALVSAGAPAGIFGLVHGVDAGVTLLRNPLLAAAGFTGSARGGLALQRICAEREVPVPFFGELGSVNPVVVLPGAASARAGTIASGYAGSLTLGAGQFCTNPGLLFVPSQDNGLLEAVAAAVSAAAGGPMLSERIHSGFETAVAGLAGHPAVRPLATGRRGEGPWAATPRAFQAGLDDFAAGLPTLTEERFGPAGLVISYPDVGSLVAVLGRLGGNLAGCVHVDEAAAGDVAAARRVLEVFGRTAGRVVVNGWPTGVAVAWAQHHGGPWPATTAPAYTSVGAAAIRRWLVPVVYQDCPPALLPPGL